MAKLDPLTTITTGFNSTAQLNENFTKIDAAFTNTLSRDGSSPNAMGAVLDMNSFRIINILDPVDNQDAVTKAFLTSFTSGDVDIAAAAASAAAALVSETNSAASENSQIKYTFATSIVMADPGAGNFRFNNATVSSVTEIAFDATMSQTGNPDVSDFIATWDDSTNTITGQLTFFKRGEAQTFSLFDVTSAADNTGWLQVTVAHIQSAGTFSAADTVDILFTRTGDIGASFVKTDITGQSSETIAPGDSIVWSDVDDTDNLKKDTIQGILDLVSPDLEGKADTVVTASDKFTFYDNTDSENPKTDTVQGILDLAQVIQHVVGKNVALSTFTTTMPGDDSIPQNTEGGEIVTVTITPKDATNRLIIIAQTWLSTNVQGRVSTAIFQDSTVSALNAGMSFFPTGALNAPQPISIRHEMAAGVTSAITFKIRVGNESAGTTTVNGESGSRKLGGVMTSYIEVLEVKA